MSRRERIEKKIKLLSERIQKLQEERDILEKERKNLFDREVLETVYCMQITPEELKEVFTKIKSPPQEVFPEQLELSNEEIEMTERKEEQKDEMEL